MFGQMENAEELQKEKKSTKERMLAAGRDLERQSRSHELLHALLPQTVCYSAHSNLGTAEISLLPARAI